MCIQFETSMASNKTFTIQDTNTGLPGVSPTSPTSFPPNSYCNSSDEEVETTPNHSSINPSVVVVKSQVTDDDTGIPSSRIFMLRCWKTFAIICQLGWVQT